jgi:hypothetical protein
MPSHTTTTGADYLLRRLSDAVGPLGIRHARRRRYLSGQNTNYQVPGGASG